MSILELMGLIPDPFLYSLREFRFRYFYEIIISASFGKNLPCKLSHDKG